MPDLEALAAALRAAEPRLSAVDSRHVAHEVADFLGRGIEAKWDFTRLTLESRGKRRSELGDALRQRRQQLNLTQAGVAQKAEWSAAKVMRIENGDVGVSPGDIAFLIRLYGVRGSRADWLRTKARESRQRRRS